MKRIGTLCLVGLLAGGCVYHWPALDPIERPHEERIPLLESIAYGAAASLLSVAVHELGHAAMGQIAGADDIDIRFFDNGKLGFTRLNGNFSKGELLWMDMAGVIATTTLGELLEFLIFEDVIPEKAQPFFATFALSLKLDLYIQTAQSAYDQDSDFAKFADRSGTDKLWYLGLIGVDLLFHHQTYVELINEARAVRREDAEEPEKEE